MFVHVWLYILITLHPVSKSTHSYSGEDSIEDTVLIEGVTFRFIDTAGIRETADTIKKFGYQADISEKT